MGGYISKSLDDNMKKQQEYMALQQNIMLERQIQMQNQMRERQMATMMARSRDLFLWFGTFSGIAVLGATVGAIKMKKTWPIGPLIPLSFLFGYQYDLAYGSKMFRIREEADRIMREEHGLLDLPQGLPTLASIEAARLSSK